jgi:abnormal spindle-like microcephaly-associated protein
MQLHNTSLALSALQAAGVQLQALPTSSGLVSLKPDDIIDGDRERTLSLLWAIARTLQLRTVLRVPALKAEVLRVVARTRVSGRRPLLPLLAGSSSSKGPGQKEVPLAVYMHDELLSALQEWVQAVCAAYDVSVQNFTTCFGDGVVLCLLVSVFCLLLCVPPGFLVLAGMLHN